MRYRVSIDFRSCSQKIKRTLCPFIARLFQFVAVLEKNSDREFVVQLSRQSSNNWATAAAWVCRAGELLSHKSVRSSLYTYRVTFPRTGNTIKLSPKNNYLSGSRCSAQWGKMSRSYKYHAAGKPAAFRGRACYALDKRERSMAGGRGRDHRKKNKSVSSFFANPTSLSFVSFARQRIVPEAKVAGYD